MVIRVGFSTRRRNILSWFIRKVTKSPVSHTWLLLEGSFFGHDMVLEAGHQGYMPIPYEVFSRTCDVVAIKTPKYSLEEGVVQQIPEIGSDYDYPGLFGGFFVMLGRWLRVKVKNPFQSSKALFCSEAIMDGMKRSGYPGTEHLNPSDVTPSDLLKFFQSEES